MDRASDPTPGPPAGRGGVPFPHSDLDETYPLPSHVVSKMASPLGTMQDHALATKIRPALVYSPFFHPGPPLTLSYLFDLRVLIPLRVEGPDTSPIMGLVETLPANDPIPAHYFPLVAGPMP